MAVRQSSTTTAGPTPAIHAGLNYQHATYTLNETASASTTLVMCALPAGARVHTAYLTIDNDALDTTGGGGVVVQSWTNATVNATYIQTASGSAEVYTFNPTHGALGYRHTASSNMVVTLHNFVGTGTATTIFSLAVAYDCQLDGD